MGSTGQAITASSFYAALEATRNMRAPRFVILHGARRWSSLGIIFITKPRVKLLLPDG